MSKEDNATEVTEREESEPKPYLSQEHHDRLMEGQGPWPEFRRSWEGEGDPWESFEKAKPNEATSNAPHD